MTKEITKANIIQEIQDKFNLREFDPTPFLFNETVVPVYNIEQHLQHFKVRWGSNSVIATGNLWFFTVPQNEKWTISRYDVIFMGAGAYTVAGVNITRFDGTPDSVYLDLTAAQTVSYHIGLSTPVVLSPGDVVSVNIDGYTSTQALRLYIDYMVEEIR